MPRSRYCFAIPSSSSLILDWARKPAGVAWVMVAVDTSPPAHPCFMAVTRMGSSGVPSGAMLTAPLLMRCPHPQEDEAAEESVTTELADAISMSP